MQDPVTLVIAVNEKYLKFCKGSKTDRKTCGIIIKNKNRKILNVVRKLLKLWINENLQKQKLFQRKALSK